MSCYDPVTYAPIPCGGFKIYNSYATDPLYQRYFTIGWISIVALAFTVILPSFLSYWCDRRQWNKASLRRPWGLYGTSYSTSPGIHSQKNVTARTTEGVHAKEHGADLKRRNRSSGIKHTLSSSIKVYRSIKALLSSIALSSVPFPRFRRGHSSDHGSQVNYKGRLSGISTFSIGTLLLATMIPIITLSTLLPESQLRSNPNRLGFLALASLPPLFLLSSKSFISPLQIVLGQSWVVVNFLHRWLGRMVLLLVLFHMGLWTWQFRGTDGGVTEFWAGDKQVRGLIALGFLTLIALSSIKPMRKFSYPLFFLLHYVGILGFLVFVNKHTVFSQGWITGSIVGIYTWDIIGRVLSLRIKWVEVVPLESGMIKMKVEDVHGGWRGGQHVALRVFFSPLSSRRDHGNLSTAFNESSTPSSIDRMTTIGKWVNCLKDLSGMFRMFESHPFSISNAPMVLSSRNTNRYSSSGSESLTTSFSPDESKPLKKGFLDVNNKDEREDFEDVDSLEGTIELYAKSQGVGSWTHDLWSHSVIHQHFANQGWKSEDDEDEEKDINTNGSDKDNQTQVYDPKPNKLESRSERKRQYLLALIEGPYGGLSTYSFQNFVQKKERLLLIAGGSGLSFILGIAEEVVNARLQDRIDQNVNVTRRLEGCGVAKALSGKVELVWVVKEEEQIDWFAPRLVNLLERVDSSCTLTLRIFVTRPPTPASTLKVTPSGTVSDHVKLSKKLNVHISVPTPAYRTTLAAQSSSSLASSDSDPNDQQISYRPVLRSLVMETINSALSPCGACYPICKCAENRSKLSQQRKQDGVEVEAGEDEDGMCPNDETSCAILTMAAEPNKVKRPALRKSEIKENSRTELLRTSSEDFFTDLEKGRELDIATLPIIERSRQTCCSKDVRTEKSLPDSCACGDGNEKVYPPEQKGCCGSSTFVRSYEGPIKVQTGGMGVIVCGPSSMIADARVSVARIPIAKQARIGGVDFHGEHYSI